MIVYNTKTQQFETLKHESKSAAKINLTKRVLESTVTKTYETHGRDRVNVSVINDVAFHWVNTDDHLNEMYQTGAYRVYAEEFGWGAKAIVNE